MTSDDSTACCPSSVLASGSTRCWRRPAGSCRTTRRSTSRPARGVAVRELVTDAGPRRLPAVRRRPGGRGDRGEEAGHDPDRGRVADGQVPAHVPDACPRHLVDGRLPFVYESTGDETRFTNRLDPEPAAGGSSRSTGPRRSAAIEDLVRPARRRYAPGSPACPSWMHDPAGCATRSRGDPNLERSLTDEPAAGADPDGDRVGQDVHRRQHLLPAGQVRRRRADPVPGRPRQPRPADAQGVPGLRPRPTTAASSPSSTTSST